VGWWAVDIKKLNLEIYKIVEKINVLLADLFTNSIGQTLPDQLTPNWKMSTPAAELETNKKGSKANLPILSW
jgi:hypothetical protein